MKTRKVILFAMAAVMTVSAFPIPSANAEESTYALGDVDMDGVITGHDSAMLSRYIADDGYTLTEDQFKLADVNDDGVVDQRDADAVHGQEIYALGDYQGMSVGPNSAYIALLYYADVAVGNDGSYVGLSRVEQNLLDVDADGEITINDVYNMLVVYSDVSVGLSLYPNGQYDFVRQYEFLDEPDENGIHHNVSC